MVRDNNFIISSTASTSLDTFESNATRRFPDDFVFGAATSAYQIEGAWNVDGKGPSIWDEYIHLHPERIVDRQNGDTAANSYEYLMEDIAAVKSMGVRKCFFILYCI